MALAIDGSGHASSFGATTLTPSLTTTQANDYILVWVSANFGPVVSVSGSSIGSFTLIGRASNANDERGELWAKFASAALTSEVITVTQTGSAFITVDAFGVSGSGQTSLVWDPNGPVIQSGSVISMDFTPSSSTSTMVVAGMTMSTDSTPPAGTGFTAISGADFTLSQYQTVTSTSTVTVETGGSLVFNRAVVVGIPLAAGPSFIAARNKPIWQAVTRASYW